VLVVARGQAMVAIAAAQCAAAGAALAMATIGWLGGGHLHGDWRIHAGALLGGVLGTAAAWRAGTERAAWLFAAAGAASLLLLAHSPYGMHDLQAIQSSSALLAGPIEAIAFAVLAVGGAILTGLRHRELRLLAVDPAHARACGMHPLRWQLLIGGWLGLSLSLTVSVQGLLVAVAFLIVPALVAGAACRALWPVLLLAPLVALAAAVGGIAVQSVFLALADLFLKGANLEHAAASPANLAQAGLLLALLALLLMAMTGPQEAVTFAGVHAATPVILLAFANDCAGSVLRNIAERCF